MRLRTLTAVVAATAFAGRLATACAPAPDRAKQTVISTEAGNAPSYDVFSNAVSPMMLLRCGTIDCHGQATRPLKLYGKDSERWPGDGAWPAVTDPTTDAENQIDFESVVGLEPENTSLVVSGQMDPASLLLLKKATGELVHKGGAVLTTTDEGFKCLTYWLSPGGNPDATPFCQSAAAPLH